MDIIQLIGSLGATLLLALFTAVMFRNRPAILTEERVRRAVARAYPDAKHSAETDEYSFVLDIKNHTALVVGKALPNPIAVLALGDRVVSRPLNPPILPRPNDLTEDSGHIKLDFNDFTAPTKLLHYDTTNLAKLRAVLEFAHASNEWPNHAIQNTETLEQP